MGRSLFILSPHNLNYSKVEELVVLLANRLQLNVDYCFPSYLDLDEYLPKVDLCDIEVECKNMYLLHDETVDPLWKKGLLYDQEYMYTWLYEKFGEDAGLLPEFKKHWEEDSLWNMEAIKCFMRDEGFWLFISNEHCFDIYRESLGSYINYEWDLFSRSVTSSDTYWTDRNGILESINKINSVLNKYITLILKL